MIHELSLTKVEPTELSTFLYYHNELAPSIATKVQEFLP
jgi:hypothetical protein